MLWYAALSNLQEVVAMDFEQRAVRAAEEQRALEARAPRKCVRTEAQKESDRRAAAHRQAMRMAGAAEAIEAARTWFAEIGMTPFPKVRLEARYDSIGWDHVHNTFRGFTVTWRFDRHKYEAEYSPRDHAFINKWIHTRAGRRSANSLAEIGAAFEWERLNNPEAIKARQRR
jgi:hypothetical protein